VKDRALIDRISSTMLELELSKIRFDSEQNRIKEELTNYLTDNKELITRDVMSYYYWETNLAVSILKASLNDEKMMINKFVQGYCVVTSCPNCGSDVFSYPRSREKRRYMKDDVLCPVCSDRKKWIKERKSKEEWEDYKIYLKKLKDMPYKEYLRTNHWLDVRRRALNRANNKCQLCYNENKLQVHHKTYERRGHEHNSDVIVLCEKCHKKFHDILDSKE